MDPKEIIKDGANDAPSKTAPNGGDSVSFSDLVGKVADAVAAKMQSDADNRDKASPFDAILSKHGKTRGTAIHIDKADRLKAARIEASETDNDRLKLYVMDDNAVAKGMDLARLARCYMQAKGDPVRMADFAVKTYGVAIGGQIAKSVLAGDGASGGFLLSETMIAEIIPLLRSAAVMRRAGARVLPMNGAMVLPAHRSGPSATYVGEGNNISKSTPTFGQVRLTPRKLALITPISNDLLRAVTVAADEYIRDEIVNAISEAEDENFIRGAGTGAGPKGLRYSVAAATNLIAANGTVNAANVQVDIRSAVNAVQNADIRLTNPGWIMAPAVREYLADLRESSGGNKVYPSIEDSNTLKGAPIHVTTSVPTNLGGGTDESEVYFGNFADFVIGDEPGLEISASEDAAYHDGSSVVSAFSKDETVLRGIARNDCALRYDRAFSVLTAAKWSA